MKKIYLLNGLLMVGFFNVAPAQDQISILPGSHAVASGPINASDALQAGSTQQEPVKGVPPQNTMNTWTSKADFIGTARSFAAGFSIGAKGYIGTGASGVSGNLTYHKDFWEWDQVTNSWTQKDDFGGSARITAVGFSIGTKGYIGTGTDGGGLGSSFGDLWEYDPAGNTWTQKKDMSGGGRQNAVGFSIGAKGYIGSGNNTAFLKDLWEWNQATDTWVKKADFTGSGRQNAMGFSIGAKGYIYGGTTNLANAFYDLWEWNQATNTWSQKASNQSGNSYLSVAFSIGNKGYIGTGIGIPSGQLVRLSTFWEWDQAADTWTPMPDFGGTARNSAVGFSIGPDKGYIGLGFDGTGHQPDLWEFSATLGVNELSNSLDISVFPNPSNGLFNVAVSGVSITGYMEIYNVSGEKVYAEPVSASNSAVDISDKSNGIYFLHITSVKGNAIRKIILDK